jgi:hypothetical protein
VWDDAFAEEALASTLRLALGYRTPRWHGVSAFAEFENVSDLGWGDAHANGGYGALSNGVTGRPTIGDPEISDLNQASVRWTGRAKATIDIGRQEIALADERYVGPVGWRQNHQSFDAGRVVATWIPRTSLSYVFVDNVNRTNGQNAGMASHLLDAKIDAGPAGSVMPYYYRLDYDDASNAALSTATLGLRWEGSVPLGTASRLPFHLEAARQTDAGDHPHDFAEDYARLELGWARDGLWLKAGWELLGGRTGSGAFSTPLATLHKWNGWADKFTTTPADGLEDLYIAAGGASGAFRWTVVYHDFRADSGGTDYGTEWDGELTWRAPWKQTFSVKAALYGADALFADTDKYWLVTGWGL